jgi:hypothetical protein
MENIDLYFLGMVVTIVAIALIDIVDSLNGVNNSFDKKEDIITVIVLVLCSWLSLFIIALILTISFAKKISKNI